MAPVEIESKIDANLKASSRILVSSAQILALSAWI
jgi:hypothetical protein